MATYNASNERMKRAYFMYLKEARRFDEATVDSVAKAIHRFEAHTSFRDFRKFHIEQAVAFKRRLLQDVSARTGEVLSKATVCATLAHLKRFVQWLAGQPGFKSRIGYSDADYFSPSERDAHIAAAPVRRSVPSIDQVRCALRSMPGGNEVELRDRALVAFTLLTGARDRATSSLRLKHVDPIAGCVYQDARDVRTKFGKSFATYFFPVGDDVRSIVVDWVSHLRNAKQFGGNDPLFPATAVELGLDRRFQANGLSRSPWATAAPIRRVFRNAFLAAGLPYFNPHSFRHLLVQIGEQRCRSPEEFKAWSQNLGHAGVLTTFVSYGSVSASRQAELMRSLATSALSVHNAPVHRAENGWSTSESTDR